MLLTPSSHGERRQLTVMFSDLVGSTELSAQLDPEDVHDIVTQYHQVATNAVNRFQGHVSQYMGDGILVLFGYPQAHENDAERAALAGLALLEDMQKLNRELEKKYKRTLSVRIGIHTGEVMIGTKSGDSNNLFGETPNVAARVQSSAEPNSVCISASTHRLVSGFFVVEDMGPHILKGVPDPLELFRVIRATGVRGRLHNASASARTPFIGREKERNILMSRWVQAQKGHGQLVMLSGEAGMGKSRLLQQFKADLGNIPHTWVEGESSPYEQDTPFAPTLDLVSNAFHWTADTSPAEKIDGLENAFALVGVDPARSVPLLASLFGIELPSGRFPPLLLSAEQQRAQLLQTLVDWVIGSARLQATVLVVEDLHFADPSTLEEFLMLSEQIENVPVLLIFTSRPRFKPPWPTKSFHTLMTLNRLDQDNVREMIEALLGKLLPPETVTALVERTDGVPLFAEELSNAIAENRTPSSIERQIPSTLQDLLMARLDFLGPVKEIAQIGSVLGRDFSYSLIALIAGQPEHDLQMALARLGESGLVIVKESSGETLFTFKHALVQEAAYGSLLKSRRRELHRAVAKALKENFSELVKTRPELLAQHLTQAGDTEPAVEAWQAAGERAAKRAALTEAMQHLNKALELLNTLPESDERDLMELPIQLTLGNVLTALKGFGSQEKMQTFDRARQLSEKLGTSTQFLIVLLGLWGTTNSRSEITASREISNEFLRLAEKDGGSMMLSWAHESQAVEAYAQGDFMSVGKHFALMQKFYSLDEQSWAPFDPLVTTSIHASLSLWQLGLADSARELVRKQYAHAQELSPTNLAMAHLGACSLYMNLEEPAVVLEHADAMWQIGVDQELADYRAWANLYRGISWIQQGQHERGITLLAQAVGEYLATGTQSSLAEYLSYLAQGYAGMGALDEALVAIQNAFGATPEEKMHLPKLHRVHADILRQQPNADLELVESTYREAIEISQKFGALTQELQAVTHLGRWLLSCGRGAEALRMLAPLYAKFSEGFDTVTLREAKEFMDEIS